MTVQLTPSWSLTTDHAASCYGIPVLVNRHLESKSFAPDDYVKCYPSWPLYTGRVAVARMASVKLDLTPEDQAAILKWCNLGKPTEETV